MMRMDRPTATTAFFLPWRRAMRRVAFAEEGAGARRPDGGFAQDPGQVGVAVPGGAVALALPGGLV